MVAQLGASLAFLLASAEARAQAEEVVVRARSADPEAQQRELRASEVAQAAGARNDVLQALLSVPGVGRPPLGAGQLVVRSSAPTDTLVLLDGAMPMALPFHLLGLQATVGPALLERAELLPGNFSSRYGRVSGGVVDLTLRGAPRDRAHVSAQAGLLDVGLAGSVRLGRSASLALSLRRSLLDAWLPRLLAGPAQVPAWYDGQLVLDWDASPRDSVRLTVAGTFDALRTMLSAPLESDPSVQGNLGSQTSWVGVLARWRRRLSADATLLLAPSFASTTVSAQLGGAQGYTQTRHAGVLRAELEGRLAPRVRVRGGLDFTAGERVDDATLVPSVPGAPMDPAVPGRALTGHTRSAFGHLGFYAEAELTPVDALVLQAGARADLFAELGNATVDPRLQARAALHRAVQLRVGLGRYASQPRGLETVPGLGNPRLVAEQWTHAMVGLELTLVPGVLFADATLFGKVGDHVVGPSAAVQQGPSGAVPLRYDNTWVGRVLGGEWWLRLRPTARVPLLAQLSYTLQRAERAACAVGCAYAVYAWDQTHLFSALVGAQLPRGFEAGARFRFSSGLVEPRVTGALYDADADVALSLVDPAHPGRLPDFVSLDVRVAWRGWVGPVRLTAVLEGTNVTNSANADNRLYSYDRRASVLVRGLPVLPNVSLGVEY